jgi:hypothetical protein
MTLDTSVAFDTVVAFYIFLFAVLASSQVT